MLAFGKVDEMKKIQFSKSLGVVEKNSVEYIQTVFAALENNVVVIPIRGLDDQQRMAVVDLSETFSPADGGGWFAPTLSLPNDTQNIAHVSFTSGTEGAPKGVLISSAALNDTVNRVQSLMQMDSGVREYIGVPVYHSFGYGRCRHVASVGGSFYIPESGFNPKELSEMLANSEVNALSLVPSLLRVLLTSPQLLGSERLQLKWLEIGSQAMTREEKLATKELFPNAVIVQHYGLTEASRSTLLQINSEQQENLDSVGCCVGDVQLSISAQGRICIKGSHLATQLITENELTPLVNDDGWFETSDLGRLHNGYLFFLGRADNVVNCGGQKLSTEKLEQAIVAGLSDVNETQSDSGIAVSKIPNELYGESFLVSYVQSDSEHLRIVAANSLKALGISASNAISFYRVPEIPKTHTGKVKHTELSQAYQSQRLENVEEDNSSSLLERLSTLFAKTLSMSREQLNVDDSAHDLGLDSLLSVQVAIKLEVMLGYLPADWRQRSIRSLSELEPAVEKPTSKAFQKATSSDKAPPLWDGSSNRNPEGVGFFALLKEDLVTHENDWFSQGLFALFVHRFGNWRMGIRFRLLRFPMTLLYKFLRKWAQIFCGIKLDYTVHVGRRVKLEHFGGMILGARSIGDDVVVRQNTTFGIASMSDLSAKPIIENGVNIGAGAVIVGNITVGRHSVIGPNAVVDKDVPPFSIVSVADQTVVQPDPKNI